MGQAKTKGLFEERKEKAIIDLRKHFPDSMECNYCKEVLKEIIPLQNNELKLGKKICFSFCRNCKKITYGFNIENEKDFLITEEFSKNLNSKEFVDSIYPALINMRDLLI